jgi:hypothetical protein
MDIEGSTVKASWITHDAGRHSCTGSFEGTSSTGPIDNSLQVDGTITTSCIAKPFKAQMIIEPNMNGFYFDMAKPVPTIQSGIGLTQ